MTKCEALRSGCDTKDDTHPIKHGKMKLIRDMTIHTVRGYDGHITTLDSMLISQQQRQQH